MKRNRLVSVLVLIVACIPVASPARADAHADTVLGPGPGSYRLESEDGTVRIPFEMYRNDIRMIAEINGQTVRLLIDNGYLWDDLLFFGSPRVDSLNLVRTDQGDVSGGGEGDPVLADFSENVTVLFPGLEFKGQRAMITHYDPNRQNAWEGAEGQVSSAFFKHFVVGINYDEGIITLTEPNRFHYEGPGEVLPLIPLEQGAWAIPATIELMGGRLIKTDLMMDLGDGSALSLFVDGPHKIAAPDKAITTCLGYGMQGPIMGSFGRVQSLTLGDYRVNNLLSAFVDGENENDYAEMMVGMPVFSRFNLWFDYPGRRLIIEPNRRYGEPMEYDMSGLFFRPSGAGEWIVERVLPDSPGDEAGLIIGDRITAINGRSSSEYHYWDLEPIMNREGEELRLSVSREEGDREFRLTLRRLL